MTELSEEEKKAIEIVKGISTDDLLNYWEGPEEPYNAIQVALNLIQKQDKIIKNQSYTNKKMKKKLDNYRKLVKLKERTIQKQDTEINKLKNVIEEYEKECRQFKTFCRKIRRDDKHDVDEFNQGQEQKCNQFLNLLAGEKHWTYEGKYFDETDKQIEKIKEDK